MAKLRKRFKWKVGVLEIDIVDWDDGTPLAYVWFGTKKHADESPTMDFYLNPKSAIILAKNILEAAKRASQYPTRKGKEEVRWDTVRK